MRELIIESEDGPIVMSIDDDGFSTHCADFGKLDADLAIIDSSPVPMNDEELAVADSDDWDNVEFGKWLANCGEGDGE